MAEHEAQTSERPETPETSEAGALTSDELLVEEVSIDGMCGVY
jgi:mycofactocin precursor